jgi:hypothetical protein
VLQPPAGVNGVSGQDGGNIDIVAWTSAPNLVFTARGGDGTPGQVGGDGGDGQVGEPYPRHAEAFSAPAPRNSYECKAKDYVNATMVTAISKEYTLYAWKGNPGKPGGDGGDSGAGANWVEEARQLLVR